MALEREKADCRPDIQAPRRPQARIGFAISA
jgi:hypothetical protein